MQGIQLRPANIMRLECVLYAACRAGQRGLTHRTPIGSVNQGAQRRVAHRVHPFCVRGQPRGVAQCTQTSLRVDANVAEMLKILFPTWEWVRSSVLGEAGGGYDVLSQKHLGGHQVWVTEPAGTSLDAWRGVLRAHMSPRRLEVNNDDFSWRRLILRNGVRRGHRP